MNSPTSNRLVAIVGGSGSGKGWLASRLRHVLGEQAGQLSLDDFYHDCSHLPREQRALVNFDDPNAIDWACVERVLRDLRDGRDTEVPCYDFATHCRRPASGRQNARPLIIVEGLWLLRPSPLEPLFDLTIYLDCSPALRLESRLARDQREREREADDIRRQFERVVAPMHDLHVEPQKQHADLVLTRPFRDEDIRRLGERLQALVESVPPGPGGGGGTLLVELLALLKSHEP